MCPLELYPPPHVLDTQDLRILYKMSLRPLPRPVWASSQEKMLLGLSGMVKGHLFAWGDENVVEVWTWDFVVHPYV